MANPLHLDRPLQSLNEAWLEVRYSFERPLTEEDYYEATHHPKYYKRSKDCQYMGLSYLRRHITKNEENGRVSRARWQKAALPMVGAAAVASYVGFSLPGIAAMTVAHFIPPKRRSDLGTREDVIGRAINRLARVFLCFAGSRQFHDSACTQPVTRDELVEVSRDAASMVGIIRVQLGVHEPRIAKSEYLRGSLRNLGERCDQFEHRRVQGAT